MARSKNSMSLPPALLRLERFWVESLQVRAEKTWSPPSEPAEVAVVGGSEYLLPEDSRHFRIRLKVKSGGKAGEGGPYRFETTVVGEFSLADEVPDDQRHLLTYINSTAILYGVARGVVATLTGMGPHGPIHLPSINFTGLVQRPPTPRKRAARPRQARQKVVAGES
jgi:preprotein translocase subunit SecB